MSQPLADGHATAVACATDRVKRQRTLKEGIASYQGGAITQKCIVRDLSPGGVKLKMVSNTPFPNKFCLQIPSDGITVDCEVRWREGNQIGCVFAGEAQVKENFSKPVIQQRFARETSSILLRR